jgi:thiol-disulfide isomerase/thioredoxin
MPCLKGFPHLVEMQRKYSEQGLVCVSVNVDEPKQKQAALGFLKQVGASFPNYLLDEQAEVWQERWNFAAPPAAFVFDRSGRRAARLDNTAPETEYTAEALEKLVKELLARP